MCGMEKLSTITTCSKTEGEPDPAPPKPTEAPVPANLECDVSGYYGPDLTGTYTLRITNEHGRFESNVKCTNSICTPANPGPSNACMYICGKVQCTESNGDDETTRVSTTATEATTEGATEATTEGATEATTEGASEATTEGATEATSGPTTEGATEATTEAKTAATTEGATEATTEAKTAATTEATTEAATEATTYKPLKLKWSSCDISAMIEDTKKYRGRLVVPLKQGQAEKWILVKCKKSICRMKVPKGEKACKYMCGKEANSC